MEQHDLRRFLFTVDRLTLQPADAAPVDKLNAKLRIYLPEDIRSTDLSDLVSLNIVVSPHRARKPRASRFPARELGARPRECADMGEILSASLMPKSGFYEAPTAISIQKGDTELLPLKFEVQFITSIQTLMEVIKAGALLAVEVYHSTSHLGDQIIGRAHVPMQPLLSETWVQGKAPVWANMHERATLQQTSRAQECCDAPTCDAMMDWRC
jgi:hypothetical protein